MEKPPRKYCLKWLPESTDLNGEIAQFRRQQKFGLLNENNKKRQRKLPLQPREAEAFYTGTMEGFEIFYL